MRTALLEFRKDQKMTNKILRLPEVIQRTGLSKSRIYKLMKDDKFPKTILLSDRAVGWIEKELDNWIESKIRLRPSMEDVRYDDK